MVWSLYILQDFHVMLYLFLNIIMKMLEFTFLNPNIYYRTQNIEKGKNK